MVMICSLISFFSPVSIAAFGMLMGSLIAGPIANLIGRKWTSIFGTCGCLASSYALIAGAQWLWMLLLGRFLHGTGKLIQETFWE